MAAPTSSANARKSLPNWSRPYMAHDVGTTKTQGRSIPLAVIGIIVAGDELVAADHVRYQRYSIDASDIDLLCEFQLRHRPRCRGNERCSRSWNGRAIAEPLLGCPCAGRSGPPWSCAASAYQNLLGSSPMLATHSCTSRAYCRVVSPERSARPAKRN